MPGYMKGVIAFRQLVATGGHSFFEKLFELSILET
jgi:hypothetical protein